MNAGKSTTLLQSSFNYRERGMNTLLLTAVFDDRYGVGKVTSRIGLSAEAELFREGDDLFVKIREHHTAADIHCVLVDEAQFLTKEQVWQLSNVCDRLGIPVLCYGIRTDFQGKLFPGSQWLLAWADMLEELKSICHCGSKAIMTVRIGENDQAVQEGTQVEIGGNDRYVSLCRRHFKAAYEDCEPVQAEQTPLD